jgi:hypothetical protein
MDMEFMGAGKSKLSSSLIKAQQKKMLDQSLDAGDRWEENDLQDAYKYQMRELWEFTKEKIRKNGQIIESLREEYYPFVFLDPRRIAIEKEAFFNYEVKNGKMVLGDCFIKTYMEDRRFGGFKIYPALGYYPFDELLLPIWRYAVENDIPIMSHCVKGVVYYRGPKKKEWNEHPVFQQEYKRGEFAPMLLPQLKNADFQVNFTHPMNYLCLLEEYLLRHFISTTKEDSPVRDLFGFVDLDTPLAFDLSRLKVCLAHFGGEEEWSRFLEQDRNVYSQRIIRNPEQGINFMKNSSGAFSWPKLHQVWHASDWYSLICTLLVNYDNMYTDISYILSKESIYPLLKQTLEKGENYHEEMEAYKKEADPRERAKILTGKNKLRSRVLFRTDFYVVRNHKSDKDLFVQIKSLLSAEEFDLIARENTHAYLTRS